MPTNAPQECSLYTFTLDGVRRRTTPKDVTARKAAQAAQDTADSKQDALTAEQLAAVNSGITADKVEEYDKYEQIGTTYTSNPYVNATAFNRIKVYRTGPHSAVMVCNLQITSALTTGTEVNIGSINGITLPIGQLQVLAGQNGAGHTVLFNITNTGVLKVWSKTASEEKEFFRAMIPLIVNSFEGGA